MQYNMAIRKIITKIQKPFIKIKIESKSAIKNAYAILELPQHIKIETNIFDGNTQELTVGKFTEHLNIDNTTTITNEQLSKLISDSHAFLVTAEKIEEGIKADKPKLTSGKSYGLTTSMMTNFGIGIELKLKAIAYKKMGIKPTNTHKYENIYTSFNTDTKNKLEDIFETWMKQNNNRELGQYYMISKKKPTPPPKIKINSFFDLIKFLDSYELYNKKYSFENFTKNKWWGFLWPSAFSSPINKITEYLESS